MQIQSTETGSQKRRSKKILKGARILVVDDDEPTRRMLDRILRGAGCDVVCAAGTAEVKEILRAPDPCFDGAVVDLRLADGRGFSVVADLRALETPCSAVMITGYDDDRAAHRSIAAGADDFMLKPFSANEILTTVGDMIEKTARWRERIVPQEGGAPQAKKKMSPVQSPAPRRRGLESGQAMPDSSPPKPTLGVLDLDRSADELVLRGGLTSRERDIVKLLLLGNTNKDIADATGATERTAKFHVSNILDKLKMRSRAELLRIFF